MLYITHAKGFALNIIQNVLVKNSCSSVNCYNSWDSNSIPILFRKLIRNRTVK